MMKFYISLNGFINYAEQWCMADLINALCTTNSNKHFQRTLYLLNRSEIPFWAITNSCLSKHLQSTWKACGVVWPCVMLITLYVNIVLLGGESMQNKNIVALSRFSYSDRDLIQYDMIHSQEKCQNHCISMKSRLRSVQTATSGAIEIKLMFWTFCHNKVNIDQSNG